MATGIYGQHYTFLHYQRLADPFYENATDREELIEAIGALTHLRASGPE